MYTRADITLDDRLEIFSRYWRFGDDYGTVSRLAEEFRTSRQFIYDVATRVKEALDWRPAGRQEVDRRSEEIARLKHRIRELEADCGDLTGQLEVERAKARQDRFRLLLELALCPICGRPHIGHYVINLVMWRQEANHHSGKMLSQY
jgi:DNA repair exonuclease SbcCD ATPase subunit